MFPLFAITTRQKGSHNTVVFTVSNALQRSKKTEAPPPPPPPCFVTRVSFHVSALVSEREKKPKLESVEEQRASVPALICEHKHGNEKPAIPQPVWPRNKY